MTSTIAQENRKKVFIIYERVGKRVLPVGIFFLSETQLFLLLRRWSDVSGGGLPRKNQKEEEIKNSSRVGGERGVSETDLYSFPPLLLPNHPNSFRVSGRVR